MTFDIKRTRDLLQDLDFKDLFNELGWSRPSQKPRKMIIQNIPFLLSEIAEVSGVAVFEVQAQNQDGKIPDSRTRRAIHQEVVTRYYENLLIFLDSTRTQSL